MADKPISFAERIAQAKQKAAGAQNAPAASVSSSNSPKQNKPQGQTAHRIPEQANFTQSASSISARMKPNMPDKPKDEKETIYFYATHATMSFVGPYDKKIGFVNHFLVTDDPKIIEHVRKNFLNRPKAMVQVKEVSKHFHVAAHTIRPVTPEIEPLPVVPDTKEFE